MKLPVSRDKFATSPVRAQFYDYLAGLDEAPPSRELAARFNITFETISRWRRSLGLRTKAQAERAQNLERAIRYLKSAEPTTYTEMCLALGFPRFNIALATDLRKFRPDLAARFKKTRKRLPPSKECENEYDVEVNVKCRGIGNGTKPINSRFTDAPASDSAANTGTSTVEFGKARKTKNLGRNTEYSSKNYR